MNVQFGFVRRIKRLTLLPGRLEWDRVKRDRRSVNKYFSRDVYSASYSDSSCMTPRTLKTSPATASRASLEEPQPGCQSVFVNGEEYSTSLTITVA